MKGNREAQVARNFGCEGFPLFYPSVCAFIPLWYPKHLLYYISFWKLTAKLFDPKYFCDISERSCKWWILDWTKHPTLKVMQMMISVMTETNFAPETSRIVHSSDRKVQSNKNQFLADLKFTFRKASQSMLAVRRWFPKNFFYHLIEQKELKVPFFLVMKGIFQVGSNYASIR